MLKKRVLDRLDKELAFRVGTVYYQAVLWYQSYHPALEFYNNVVAPLNRLSILG